MNILDTMQMLSNYCEVIALRHPEVNACDRAILASKKPIINAGDGTEEVTKVSYFVCLSSA